MNSERVARSRYFYKAYGLEIESDIELGELIPARPGGSDVRIRLGRIDDDVLEKELIGGITRSGFGIRARASTNAVSFHWRGVGTAVVRNGCDVTIQPATGLDERDLSPYISGSILAVLLHQRGLLVLHASAVVIRGQAVAFLGDKGAGKSTFAAFLKNRGHDVITDDLVPVSFSEEGVFVSPGFPRIKLCADSVESIGVDPRTVPMINSFLKKHSYQCSESFVKAPIPLSRLYVLDEGSPTGIESLKSIESFIEIVRNCYLGKYADATGQTVTHFRNCAALAARIPLYRLRRPHDFGALPKISEMIEERCNVVADSCR